MFIPIIFVILRSFDVNAFFALISAIVCNQVALNIINKMMRH